MYPAFEARNVSKFNHNLATKVQFDTENLIQIIAYDNSTNYRFTSTVAGKYFVYGHLDVSTFK